MPRPPFLTAAEAAQILRVKPATVVKLCATHKIPATKPAGLWLIKAEDLDRLIESKRNNLAQQGAA